MWYPVLDEERGMVMNKSQPDLVEVVAEGGCLLLLEFETGELRRLDVSSFLKRGGAYERLRDDEYLKLVRIIDGGMALGWPDGQEVRRGGRRVHHSRRQYVSIYDARVPASAGRQDPEILRPGDEE